MNNGKQVILVPNDVRTIVAVLNKKLRLGLSQDSINIPTPETAFLVYMNFVRVVLDVNDIHLATLPMSANTDHDPELHRKSVPLIIVFQCMKAFISDNSGQKLDMRMCDFVIPGRDIPRFKKLMSFLVEFIKLHEMAAPVFNEISGEFSDQKQEIEALQREINDTEKKKTELLSRQSLRKRRENELMDDHSKIKNELNGIVCQYSDNLAATEEMEKQKAELIQQIEDINREILTTKKTAEHLSEEVLESPEELKREMTERKKQIEELRECLAASRQTLKAKLDARDICANSEKNVPVMQQRLETWNTVREDILTLMDVIEAELRKLAEMEEQLAFTTDKKNNSGKRMIEQAEMHEQLKREHLQRNEKLSKNIEEIVGQIAALGKNQPEVSRDIEKKRQELLAAKNAHSERMSQIVRSTKEACGKFQKIDAHFKDLHRVAQEKRCAMDRAKNRLCNSFKSRLPSDYTFSASSINEEASENCDPQSPVFESFSVFKN